MNARVRLIALALAVAAVATMLLISRCSSGHRAALPEQSPAASSQASAAAVPSEAADDDDGAVDTTDSPAVITTGPAETTEAAINVVVKLLNTTGKTAEQWHATLRPYVSDALFAELADADPQTVPVGRVDDAHVSVATAGDALVVATVPVVDTNSPPRPVATIRVTLSGLSHRWLATELDVVRA